LSQNAGKIVLEEHFALPETVDISEKYFTPDVWPAMRHSLVDLHGRRLEEMDRSGVEIMFLSLNSPGPQAVYQRQRAVDLARRANDYLAEEVGKNPGRFQGFAALAMQDPDAAAAELTRCVKALGFRGALVNGFSQVDQEDSAIYYDLPQYWPFWKTAEDLGVPVYLHPRDQLPSRLQAYEGHPWLLGAPWGFAADTALHALRLMGSGLFDRYPKLTILLGHLGEGLPASIWRVDHRIARTPKGIPAKKPFSEYLRSNFLITTSGNFRTPTLVDAIEEVGAERILLSVDYPFEDLVEGASWLDSAEISDAQRRQIASGNARRIFRLA
jgi:predicted TIM-barrel fold metal-dependent hydrolase